VVGAVAVVVLGLAAIVLTDAVVNHAALAVLDLTWRDWVIAHRTGALTQIMVGASRAGSTPSLIVVALAAAAWLMWRGRRGDSLLVVGGAMGAFALGPLLKLVVERPRPDVAERVVLVNSWSYPSGHSLNSLTVLGLLTVLAVLERPGRLRKVLLSALGVVLVAAVGFSRVYLGVHWPSDVLGGWLIGVLWLTICFTVTHLARGNTRASGTVPDSS
jgi:membrane-associated phospholipid phosphatase